MLNSLLYILSLPISLSLFAKFIAYLLSNLSCHENCTLLSRYFHPVFPVLIHFSDTDIASSPAMVVRHHSAAFALLMMFLEPYINITSFLILSPFTSSLSLLPKFH
ncbi:MAG: hypothetical protein NXY57DRAFT_264025 [Lentinula lateritia]|nr:MAG: hypothetical protein NXY57DRAFT_264025 [Lentinula lateritia]